MNSMRMPSGGGLIRREQVCAFSFDGRTFEGYDGDTIASALLANGVRIVGRSFKYHRPRGILTIGSEEPNALLEVGEAGRREPNTRATDVYLYGGLTARSQNRFPSLRWDLGGIASLFSELLPAGFYYKTFKWPSFALYEPMIRRMAGLGKAPSEPTSHSFTQAWRRCDVLVIGGGVAGLRCALSVARSGASVCILDENPFWGGWARRENFEGDNAKVGASLDSIVRELRSFPNVQLISRTVALGQYGSGFVTALERLAEPGEGLELHEPAQRLHLIKAERVVIATGAIEQPLVFPANDKPGVMLCGAVRGYINAFGVKPGSRALILTNNDHAYRTAKDLDRAGVKVVAVVDTRVTTTPRANRTDLPGSAPVLAGADIAGIAGGESSKTVFVTMGREIIPFRCDLVCMSGGWSPALSLFVHAGGAVRISQTERRYESARGIQGIWVAGAANGHMRLRDASLDADRAGLEIVADLGRSSPEPTVDWCSDVKEDDGGAHHAPIVDRAPPPKKAFVDFQNDVCSTDIIAAAKEGYTAVEHVKRYTTLGMGTDQGKTSSLNGVCILAQARQAPPPEIGITTFRPPVSPVSLGAFAAGRLSADLRPVRRTPLHEAAEQSGARHEPIGDWLRARFYPNGAETLQQSAFREARNVRNRVGVTDVSTLGKIEILGSDASAFLDSVCTWGPSSLKVGRARYNLLLREDGFILDDGTVWRLEAERFFLTTSTANRAQVLQHLEYLRSVMFAGANVFVVDTTEHWAAVALAGPQSRALISRVCGVEADVPHLGVSTIACDGHEMRVARVSYSGERAYEVYVPASRGAELWLRILEEGRDLGAAPYGLEALDILRIEKGHLAVGHEISGRTTIADLGVNWAAKGSAYFGYHASSRPALTAPDRLQLVGLRSLDAAKIPEGAHILSIGERLAGGHVTSAAQSVELGTFIALGLLERGRARMGEKVLVVSPVHGVECMAIIENAVFVDPEGKRLKS